MNANATEKSTEWWPTERLVPFAGGALKCPEGAVVKVAASLKDFGFRQPIVVDEAGVIIVGHTRLLAAQRLGLAEVPVHVACDLTPPGAPQCAHGGFAVVGQRGRR